MSFSFVPKSDREIRKKLAKDCRLEQVSRLYQICLTAAGFSMTDPISIDVKDTRLVKVCRALTDKFKDIRNQFYSECTGVKVVIGDGSRGKKGVNNTGLVFERELLRDFNTFIREGADSSKIKHKKFINEFVHGEGLSKSKKIAVKLVGKQNVKRPLTVTQNQVYIGDSASDFSAGKEISDITVKSDADKLHLSLKYGDTISFFNVGVKKYFPEDEISGTKEMNPLGKNLLRVLGIDQRMFNSQFVTQSGVGRVSNPDFDREKIRVLLSTGIGCEYYLVHKKNTTRVDYKFLNKEMLKKLTSLNYYYIDYPKNGKRINIYCGNTIIKMNMNIRSKTGGIMPTHMMCDYNLTLSPN